MKAKEAYKILSDQTSIEQLRVGCDKILNQFICDIHELIKARNAKTYTSIKAIVIEANNKWKSLYRLCNNSNIALLNEYITEDQFELELSKEPRFKRMLDPKPLNGSEYSTINISSIKLEENTSNLHMNVIMPLNQITKENITSELFSCLVAVGSYYENGIPIPTMIPLLQRIKLLEYWVKNGINYNDIELFNNDRVNFIKKILHNN